MRAAAMHLILLAAIAIFTIWLGYIGFRPSDDQYYSMAAVGWLDHFPYIGATHWELRHTVVLPLALSFWLGGINETSLMLPTLMYLLLLMALTYGCLGRLVEPGQAVLAAALVALTPVFVLYVSSASDDITECFFVAASIWAFYFGSTGTANRALLLLSGICAGLGFITRETSIILVLFYGVLFLSGWRIPRIYYLLIGAGFSVVWAIDTLYLATMTGDVLYRIHVAARQVAAVNRLDAKIVAVQNGFDPWGQIASPRVLQPVLMLFTAHEVFPLFLFAIPAGFWLWNNRGRHEPQFEVARLSCLLGATWFVAVSWVLIMLWVVPRYYTVTAYCALLVVALWLQAPRRQGGSLIPIAVLCAGSLMMIYLDHKNEMFDERALVAIAHESDEPIYTDPETLRGARFLLESNAPGRTVIAGMAPSGGLYFYNPMPGRRELDRASLGKFEPSIKPSNTWTLLRTVVEDRKLSARILRAIGLEPLLPVGVVGKLDPSPHVSYLYRLPAQNQ
jgi:4-amino-4-deoxy-L-arabinose transferase-like glycosyltransferase